MSGIGTGTVYFLYCSTGFQIKKFLTLRLTLSQFSLALRDSRGVRKILLKTRNFRETTKIANLIQFYVYHQFCPNHFESLSQSFCMVPVLGTDTSTEHLLDTGTGYRWYRTSLTRTGFRVGTECVVRSV